MNDRINERRASMCSVLAKARSEDPIAHASNVDRRLFLELKKPWARNRPLSPRMHPGLRDVLLGQQNAIIRLREELGPEEGTAEAKRQKLFMPVTYLAPDKTYSSEGLTRAIHMVTKDGPFPAFEREELLVPDDLLPELVEAITRDARLPEKFSEYRQDVGDVRDILVCTQGNVDTCCATFGIPTYRAMRQEAALMDEPVRVWEATHFQSHRFAPVVMELPDMRFWGFLDESSSIDYLRRTMEPERIRQHYMGWSGYGASPSLQVAEREAFVRMGWEWLSYRQRGKHLSDSAEDESAVVQIEYECDSNGPSGAFEVVVRVSGQEEVQYGCLRPEYMHESKQYEVTNFRTVSAVLDRHQ